MKLQNKKCALYFNHYHAISVPTIVYSKILFSMHIYSKNGVVLIAFFSHDIHISLYFMRKKQSLFNQ